MKNTSTIPTPDFCMKIYGSELQQASLYAFSYDFHDTIMNKASTRYSNDYIFSMSVQIEVHQLSKVAFFLMNKNQMCQPLFVKERS